MRDWVQHAQVKLQRSLSILPTHKLATLSRYRKYPVTFTLRVITAFGKTETSVAILLIVPIVVSAAARLAIPWIEGGVDDGKEHGVGCARVESERDDVEDDWARVEEGVVDELRALELRLMQMTLRPGGKRKWKEYMKT